MGTFGLQADLARAEATGNDRRAHKLCNAWLRYWGADVQEVGEGWEVWDNGGKLAALVGESGNLPRL